MIVDYSRQVFISLDKLEYLNMSGNYLECIKNNYFSGLDSLVNHDISRCRIKNVERESFKRLKCFKCLHLFKNRIQKNDLDGILIGNDVFLAFY